MYLPSFGQAVPDTTLMKHPIPDSAKVVADRVRALPNDAEGVRYTPEPWQPNPKKAGLYSAILPGSGQLYNRQYWKIPVVLAGVGVAAYVIKFNSDQYRTYRRAYIASLDQDPATVNEFEGLYGTAQLQQLQDGYKRYLDMSVLFTVVGYTLQVIDAVVFAHLRNFDMSRDLSLKLSPVADPYGAGIGLVVNFK